jgi:signal transduction histidine kinase
MRSGDTLATVGTVAGDQVPDGAPRRHAPLARAERQRLTGAVLAAFAGVAIISLMFGPYPPGPQPRILVAVVACGPIVWLRRWPLPVLAVAVGAGALLITLSGNLPLVLAAMTGLAVYFVALRGPRRVSIPAAVAAAAVVGAALLYAVLAARTTTPSITALTGFLPIVAAWFTGDSVAARRRYLAGLARQAERERVAEARRAGQQIREERVRIARELHDVVAHTLAVITVQAGVGRRLAAMDPAEAGSALESIETISRTAQDELRVVLGLLRDEEAGAAALAPMPRLADLKALAETVRASGIAVELRTSGTDRELSPALELSVYRVVQEALTNVVRHAPGARAVVDLAVSASDVRLEITDDGGTASREWAVGPGPGHGIVGMRERLGAFGGWLVAEPLPHRGFRVTGQVPAEGPG